MFLKSPSSPPTTKTATTKAVAVKKRKYFELLLLTAFRAYNNGTELLLQNDNYVYGEMIFELPLHLGIQKRMKRLQKDENR